MRKGFRSLMVLAQTKANYRKTLSISSDFSLSQRQKKMALTEGAMQTGGQTMTYFAYAGEDGGQRLYLWRGTNSEGHGVDIEMSSVGGMRTETRTAENGTTKTGFLIVLDRQFKPMLEFDCGSKGAPIKVARDFTKWKAKGVAGSESLFASKPRAGGGGFRKKKVEGGDEKEEGEVEEAVKPPAKPRAKKTAPKKVAPPPPVDVDSSDDEVSSSDEEVDSDVDSD